MRNLERHALRGDPVHRGNVISQVLIFRVAMIFDIVIMEYIKCPVDISPVEFFAWLVPFFPFVGGFSANRNGGS